MSPRQAALLVVAAALLATAPAWAPGALLYMDNPCHLAELQALATRVLPEQRWFHGWADVANAGGDVGGLNAPLPWTLLALATWAGLPLAVGYRLAMVAAAAAAGLGTLALGRRLGLAPTAAALAGVLVAVLPLDTLGIGGGLAGMWPYRLANGLLWFGLARLDGDRPRTGPWSLWLAAVLLCHPYAGVVAAGWTTLLLAEHLLGRRWRPALGLAAAGALGAAIAAPWWVPQVLSGGLGVREITHLSVPGAAALLTLPVEPHDVLTGRPWTLLGGPPSVPIAALLALGLVAAVARGARAWASPLARRLLVALALLLALACAGGFGLLGPNPWRHLAQGRAALCLAAAAGLAPWLGGRGRAALFTLGLAAWSALVTARDLPTGRTAHAQIAALEATWRDLAAASPAGRVYHQETFQDPAWAGPLAWSHVGPLLTVRHGLPTLGSWYGVTPVPTVPFTTDQGIGLMGTLQDVVLADPDWLYARFRRFGVGAVVTVEPALAAFLAADQRYRLVAAHAPFSAFALLEPPLGPLGVADRAARVQVEAVGPARIIATVALTGTAPFVVRQAWDPGWSATLDGVPLPLAAGSDDGLVTGTLPGAGRLVVDWRPRSRPWAPLGLAALLAALILARRAGERA